MHPLQHKLLIDLAKLRRNAIDRGVDWIDRDAKPDGSKRFFVAGLVQGGAGAMYGAAPGAIANVTSFESRVFAGGRGRRGVIRV